MELAVSGGRSLSERGEEDEVGGAERDDSSEDKSDAKTKKTRFLILDMIEIRTRKKWQ